MEKGLELKIEYLEKLADDQHYRDMRRRMVLIWKHIRRGFDESLQCMYLRYAYRQIAEDINQIALESNLESLRYAMKVLQDAYKRIAKYKNSDDKIIKKIEKELEKHERFAIVE
jgi:hypothetical protein